MASEQPQVPEARRDRPMWPWVLLVLALLAVTAWAAISRWGGREDGEQWSAERELPPASRAAPEEPPPPPAPALALHAFTADCVEVAPPEDPRQMGTYARACFEYAAETLRAAAGVRGEAVAIQAELTDLDAALDELRKDGAVAPASRAALAAVAAAERLGAPEGADGMAAERVERARRAAEAVGAAGSAGDLVAALHRAFVELRPLLAQTVPGFPGTS